MAELQAVPFATHIAAPTECTNQNSLVNLETISVTSIAFQSNLSIALSDIFV